MKHIPKNYYFKKIAENRDKKTEKSFLIAYRKRNW